MASVPDFQSSLRRGLRTGISKGVGTFIWMCKIIIPISFIITVVQWSGWLYKVDFLLNPLMNLINLPSEAALPIISGMIINIYATIAILVVIPFSIEQMTLIAVFVLIAHNLIAEGIIQFKSGINIIKITMIRISAAILTVLIISQFLGDTTGSLAPLSNPTIDSTFIEALRGWAISTIGLLIRIFAIIMSIMITLESLKSLGWVGHLISFFKPAMGILGLSNRVSIPWVTAIVFGLMYGGATILEEAKRINPSKTELEHLHISIGINHSMLEDPSLFLALGLNAFWLWVPKFIMAIIIVQIFRLAEYLKRRIS
ncbi:iron transporter [Chloroflexota bacterium]